ncbi:Plasmid stabilization system protein [compost metagenome]
MSDWRVEFTPSADRAFRKLARDVQDRIRKKLRRFTQTGAGDVIAMVGRPGELRMRVDDYRVVFERQGDRLVILVLYVGNRRDVYRG